MMGNDDDPPVDEIIARPVDKPLDGHVRLGEVIYFLASLGGHLPAGEMNARWPRAEQIVFDLSAAQRLSVVGTNEVGVEEEVGKGLWANATSTEPDGGPLVRYPDKVSAWGVSFGGSISAYFSDREDGVPRWREWRRLKLSKPEVRSVLAPLIRDGILARRRDGRITAKQARSWAKDLMVGRLPRWPGQKESVDPVDMPLEPPSERGFRRVERPVPRDALESLIRAVKESADLRISEVVLLQTCKSDFPTLTRVEFRILLPEAIEAAGNPAAWTKKRRPPGHRQRQQPSS